VPPNEEVPESTVVEWTRTAARQLLRNARLASGRLFGESRAQEYVESFSGWITTEVLQPGETYYRYASSATSQGGFLRSTRYATPEEARAALNLPPENTAEYVQTVTIEQPVLAFTGDVERGTGSQVLLYNPAAASLGHGVPTEG
jgi:hypothetical protein